MLQQNVQLYLVKWRNLSYLHCTWESEEELMRLEGPRMKQKIMVSLSLPCDLALPAQRAEPALRPERLRCGRLLQPDYTEVDRVLDVRIVPKDESVDVHLEEQRRHRGALPETEYREHGLYVKEFRVKWRGLPYKDLSWEIFDDFQDSAAIVAYYDHLNRDVSMLNNPPSWRPSISEYPQALRRHHLQGRESAARLPGGGVKLRCGTG